MKKRNKMHRLTVKISPVIALLCAALMVSIFSSTVSAQDSTPPAGPIAVIELVPGITAEVLGAAPSAVAPGQTVYTVYFDFEPGAEIFPHGHPGTTVLGVRSGTFGWTLVTGTAHVIRGAGAGATGPIEDITVPGTDVILEPGDEIYYESDVIHTARAAGDTPAIVLGSLVLTTGAPLLMPAGMDMSTPTT
jgi:quercetin dioxygenase-like cupin family protein